MFLLSSLKLLEKGNATLETGSWVNVEDIPPRDSSIVGINKDEVRPPHFNIELDLGLSSTCIIVTDELTVGIFTGGSSIEHGIVAGAESIQAEDPRHPRWGYYIDILRAIASAASVQGVLPHDLPLIAPRSRDEMRTFTAPNRGFYTETPVAD